MRPTTDTHPAAQPSPGGGATLGGARTATAYYDEQGMRHRARTPVPVDEYGRLTAAEYRCTRCKNTQWFPLAVANRGTPVCDVDHRRMTRLTIKGPSVLPWKPIWEQVERPMRAVWVGAGMAAAGVVADSNHMPAAAPLVLAAPIAVGAQRFTRSRMVRRAVERERRVTKNPEAELGKRQQATIERRTRSVAYCATAACGWTALAASAGVDPNTFMGRVTWLALAAAWLYPAATWWRHVRSERRAPEQIEIKVPEGPAGMDPDEEETRRIWSTVVAVAKGKKIGTSALGDPMFAPRNGKLVGTTLEDWHKVAGGWAATAVGEDGVYLADHFVGARGAIAGAFHMKTSMITCIPDADDENRALYLAQRTSPIADIVGWAGPDSIDVHAGLAPVATYVDGTPVLYELYRPGWGSPHVAAFGTTGSGKSEYLNLTFAIDRWAHYIDADGNPRGIAASFLIDPQQGQSFAPFMDDLAAPVATTLDEALMLVRALTAEGKRRNKYLTRVEWLDPKRNKMRRGRKWWNPLVDGPILTLTIDEAHEYLSNREFCALVTSGGRMWRKCGIQLRIGTHTPLLQDLGGSMALRDMLTGCFVWMGRVANSLSAPTAFNGRLPVDPRTIPAIPGMAYILTGLNPKAMLARTMWEEDFYDYVRDLDDNPIGYPATLPAVTLEAFGPEFARWSAGGGSDGWVPELLVAAPNTDVRSVDCVASVLAAASTPMDMDALNAAMRSNGWEFSVRTIRDALKKLRAAGSVFTSEGRHELTPQTRASLDEQMAEAVNEVSAAAAEGGPR